MRQDIQKRIDATNKPYKIYAEILEDTAAIQFAECMEQQSVVQGALMADCHTGYAAPIGSVLATDNTVFPSFVGYDIGCTDSETEYLSPYGWKKISDYTEGEMVMGYDPRTYISEFEKPVRYIVNEDEELFYHLNNGVVDQMITSDHKMLLFGCNNDKPRYSQASVAITKNKSLKNGLSDKIKTVIPNYKTNQSIDLLNEELQLIVAIVADGRVRGNVVEFHLVKERKIKRLRDLLNWNNITMNEHKRINGNFSCSFNWIHATKSLALLWSASKSQLLTAANESIFWDGYHKENGQRIFFSTNKESIDIIQFAFAVNGIRTNYYKTEYESDWKDSYQLYTTNNQNVLFPKHHDIKEITHDPDSEIKSYCFTMSSGYWLMRRNGKIAITGNCGVISSELNVTADELDLGALKASILRSVPIGFNRHKKKQLLPGKLAIGYDNASDMLKHTLSATGLYQLGTLGGGNHFIELGTNDKTGNLHITIHSGSRGFGHKIATHYMKEAAIASKDRDSYVTEFHAKNEKWLASCYDRPVYERHAALHKYEEAKELFVSNRIESATKNIEGAYPLDLSTDLGKQYMIDQNFALEYALANREAMVMAIQNDIFRQIERPINILHTVNRNHNHAELKDGLIIHRKGATHAELNMEGIIPGNMRDGSFIVKGKGNPESMCSSSHGAGRVLSRRKAKETLSIDEFRDETAMLVTNHTDDMLDEAPKAYKNIFEVMELQLDLVEVIDRIIPILNIKG